MRRLVLICLLFWLSGLSGVSATETPSASALTEASIHYGLRHPLRLGWIGPQWLETSPPPPWLEKVPQTLLQFFKTTSLPVVWTPPEQIMKAQERLGLQSLEFPTNTQIIALALHSASDVIITASIAHTNQQYWIWFKAMSSSTGYVVAQHKYTTTTLEPQQFTQILDKWLKSSDWAHWTHGMIDIGNREDSGTLRVETSPPKIALKLNQEKRGTTPLLLRHLPVGEHVLEVSEIQPYEIRTVKITSEPSGIPIKINQTPYGLTPVILNQNIFSKPGNYILEFDTTRQSKRRIEIQTNPEGIPVQLNGTTINRTPITFQNLTENPLILSFLEQRPRSIRQLLKVTPNSNQHLYLELYKPGHMVLESSEANTEVFVDNEKWGETPFSSQITPGIHTIELKKNRFIAEKKEIYITPGKNHTYAFQMRSARSLDTSTFLVPTAQLSQQVHVGTRYFGFGQYTTLGQIPENIHLFGIEADYGFPDLWQPNVWMNIGLSVGTFFYIWQGSQSSHTMQGPTLKVQLLRESPEVPVSAAVGGYWNIGAFEPGPVGFITFSRSFSDFMFHFGLQTHGLNVNFDYTGISNLRLGAAVFLDSFFGVFTGPNQSMTPLYGLTAGYSF